MVSPIMGRYEAPGGHVRGNALAKSMSALLHGKPASPRLLSPAGVPRTRETSGWNSPLVRPGAQRWLDTKIHSASHPGLNPPGLWQSHPQLVVDGHLEIL